MRYFVAARVAISVFVLFNTDQSRLQALSFNIAVCLLGLGHRLILQRIHATEAAHRLLIQFHDGLGLLASGGQVFKFGQPLADLVLEIRAFRLIHFCCNTDHGFAFGVFLTKWHSRRSKG